MNRLTFLYSMLKSENSQSNFDEAQEPDSRELHTYEYRTRTGRVGSFEGTGRKRTVTKRREWGDKNIVGIRTTRLGGKSSGRKRTTSRWDRKYGTRYYKARTTDVCNTLFIVKDDSSRSTRSCVDDIMDRFRYDFDKVLIASSERSDSQARDGDIVVFVDSGTDCADLWLVADRDIVLAPTLQLKLTSIVSSTFKGCA